MGPRGLEIRGALARVDLDAARRVPLLDAATMDRLRRCLDEGVSAGVRALIISGGSAGTFAAGADLIELSRLDPIEAVAFAKRGQDLFDRLERFPGATIAAIRGRCIGGAFDLVMACDLRLASEEATFSHPGPRLGFITGYGGTSRLPLLAGPAARPVLLGMEEMDAARALEVGFLADVTGAAELDGAARALAERICGASPERLRLMKEVLQRLSGASSARSLERRVAALASAAVCG